MGKIVELWLAGVVPAVDGLFRADDSARAVDVDDAELSRYRLGPAFDVLRLLDRDPDNVIEIDICAQVEISGGSGFLCCGEGALGSYGFFARLDAAAALLWVVALQRSNPFLQINLTGSFARFTNNLGNSITIDLLSPDYS